MVSFWVPLETIRAFLGDPENSGFPYGANEPPKQEELPTQARAERSRTQTPQELSLPGSAKGTPTRAKLLRRGDDVKPQTKDIILPQRKQWVFGIG